MSSIDHFVDIDQTTAEYNQSLLLYLNTILSCEQTALWYEKLELPLCPRVRGYFHINPQMPLGAICSQSDVDRLAITLENFPDVTVMDDLTYYDLRLSSAGTRPGTFANSKVKERTLTLYSASKQFAFAGVRAGIALGPQYLIQPIAKDIFNTVNTANTFSTQVLLNIFTWGKKKREQYLLDTNTEYAFRRDFALALIQGIHHIKSKSQVTRIREELIKLKIKDTDATKLLEGINGLTIITIPESGYFLLIDFSHYVGKFLGTTPLQQSRDFRNAFYCLTDVNTIPGELMYEFDKPILRFSYSIPTKDVLEGLLRIKAVLALTQDTPLTVQETNEAKVENKPVKPTLKKSERQKTFTPHLSTKRLTDEENFKISMANIHANRTKGKRKIKPTQALNFR